MSWEAWGSGDDPVDPEQLYRLGWDCDETCEKWWKIGEPEDVYTLEAGYRMVLGLGKFGGLK